uniref:Death associated protein n=1 Tax=Phasianus colchicus TaxID=9054 RepID=A0A669P8Q6_PHACC
MSSPPKEKAETRAGHPPAVKAGGMRIVQKHPHSSDTKEEKDKDDQDWETSSPPKPTVFISGVIARGDKDFPPAAAQVAHQKPHPSVEKLPHPQHVKQHIHQPRKLDEVLLCKLCVGVKK